MIDRTILSVGATEVVNAHRTLTYLNAARLTGTFQRGCGVYCGSPSSWTSTTFPVSGSPNVACWQDAGAFSTVTTDPAPWYSASRPESAHFLGCLIDDFGELDRSTYERALTPRATRGSVIGRPLVKGRTFKLRLLLFAISCQGMEYGQRWLNSVFQACDGCVGANATLTFRAACPPNPPPASTDFKRQLVGASLLSMSSFTGLHEGDTECDCYFQQIEVTIGSESADLFDSVATATGTTNTGIVLGSPAACTQTINCCNTMRDLRRYQWQAVSMTPRLGADVAPLITVENHSGGIVLNNFRIEIYSNPGGANCSNQQPIDPAFQCESGVSLALSARRCGVIVVQGLPNNYTLTIDGRTGDSWVTDLSGNTYPGDNFFYTDGTAGPRGIVGCCGPMCILGAMSSITNGNVANHQGAPPSRWTVTWVNRYRVA